MKAVRFYAKEDVRVEDVPPPDALGDSQLLIKPLTCGICGTDLHEFAGGPIVTPATPHKFTGAVLPQILGHEFSAEVVEIGRNVKRRAQGRPHLDSAPGDAARRLLQPSRPQSSEPEHGLHRSELGLGRHGRTCGHQRLQRQPRFPTMSPTSKARMVEPTAVALYGVDRAKATGGSTVLVTGRRPDRRARGANLQRGRRLEDFRQRAQRQSAQAY